MIVLGIAALAAGVYFLFRGASEEDTPLEVWLSRCFYRKDALYANTERRKFTAPAEELRAFQEAVYGLHITLEWNDRWGKDEIALEVIMPGYTRNSDYAYLLELKGAKFTTRVNKKASEFSHDLDLKPEVKQHYLSALTPGQKLTPLEDLIEIKIPLSLRVENGVGILSGKVRASENYFNGARLKFEYWPDVIQHLELKMTPAPGGLNYREVQD